MHGSIMRLVESYGYGIVFLFVAIESLGVPLPGETVLVTAGALAALGHLSIWWVIAMLLAIGYFVYLFHSFRGKVAVEQEGHGY